MSIKITLFDNSETFIHGLADLCDTHAASGCSYKLKQYDKAQLSANIAVTNRESLVAKDPKTYEKGLAEPYDKCAEYLHALGRDEGAVQYLQKLIWIRENSEDLLMPFKFGFDEAMVDFYDRCADLLHRIKRDKESRVEGIANSNRVQIKRNKEAPSSLWLSTVLHLTRKIAT